MNLPAKLTIVTVAIVIAASLLLKRCNKPTNDIVNYETYMKDTAFHYKEKWLKDSAHYVEVEAKLASSQNLIGKLQDSLQQALSNNSGIKPTGVIKWKETISYKDVSGEYKDSVDALIDSIQSNNSTLNSLIISNANNLISVPRAFILDTTKPWSKWMKGSGVVTKKSVEINSLDVISAPTVVWGEKSKKFLGINTTRPTVSVAIGNENPYVHQSDPKAYLYTTQEKKWALVGGVGATYYGGKVVFGPQLTLGYKIL